MSDLFSPSVVRELSHPGYTFKQITNNQLTESSPPNEQIWRDDPYGTGLKSTQQVPLDWSDFTAHTFFNSAESKVNVAFERIVNQFPFDGSKMELVEFKDSLSGFEKYVFDKWPKFIGDLKFSKSSSQYILTQDKSGYLFPEISRNILGERSVGNTFAVGEFTAEFWLYASSSTAYDNQTIFQKLNSANNHGISIFLSESASGASTVPVIFGISSGSTYLSASMNIEKGSYVHCSFVYDKEDFNSIKMYKNSSLVSSSSASDITSLDFLDKNFHIGSGSSQDFDQFTFTPAETLDANIDEFRFWKIARSQSAINEFYKDNVFQNEDLSFYYRFNEPTGSYSSKAIALDHSGNGLHGQIQNYSDAMRGSKEQVHLPVFYERPQNSPTLFPDYTDLINLNEDLLTSGSRYDNNNPNLITKLVPRHYFLEAQAEEGFEKEFGALDENYGHHDDGAFPGNGKIPTAQVISSFLFIWASFFDEIKVYIDSFAKLHDISHSEIDSIPAQFLQKLARKYGIELPNSFDSVSIDQFSEGKKISNGNPYSALSLKKVQELLWRRLLKEMPTINRMKGTVQSVRSLMLSLGINPDSSFRIREYGGPKSKKLASNKKLANSYYNTIDFSKGTPFLSSSHLIGYRHEPGLPFGAPTPEVVLIDHMGGESSTIKVATPASGPILTSFTSASWSWEGHYQLKSDSAQTTQSLFRIEVSGSVIPNTGDPETSIAVNLTATSGSIRGGTENKMILAFSGSETSKLTITGSGINVFDGDPWYINVNHVAKSQKSEFIVRAYKTLGDELLESHYFSGSYDNSSATDNRLIKTSGYNRSLIAIGYNAEYYNELLNYSGDNTTHFDGKIGGMRFWTKALEENEAKEHAFNPYSVGVNVPLTNYNFFFDASGTPIANISTQIENSRFPFGSWERLRLSTDVYQEVSSSNSNGKIDIIDTSQNGAFSGRNFTASTQVFTPTMKMFARLDPDYDITINANKVRVKSFIDKDLAEESGAESGAIYELDPREPITDDRRFSVEASIVQALNEDIVNILADNQYINDAMGTPEMMFSLNYPALEKLADKYFYRLTDKVNTTEYLKFFKWFDNNFGQLIEKLMPRTTEFLGINFVIESHMLERHRFEYKQADVHIDLNSRLAARIDPVLEGKIRNEGT